MAKPTKQEVSEALAKQSIPTDVPKDGFYAPKTQKALNNQGFEYGGSVEIRILIQGPTPFGDLSVLKAPTTNARQA